MLPMSMLDHPIVLWLPGAPCRVGPRATARCERGRAQRSRLDDVLVEALRALRKRQLAGSAAAGTTYQAALATLD